MHTIHTKVVSRFLIEVIYMARHILEHSMNNDNGVRVLHINTAAHVKSVRSFDVDAYNIRNDHNLLICRKETYSFSKSFHM